jgi:segregation and condensation protein A
MQHSSNDPEQPRLHLQKLQEQSEMPFAIVQGEPVTSLPRDLYIPPDALEVILEAFEGPLDLLLYLIRRQNLDILDVPIAEITRQYMEYIDLMKVMRLELAAEYLVMAAMLAEIKSRMLLPRSPLEEGHEEDPRAELVRRLQEYERYKSAAEDMDALPRIGRDVHLAGAEMGEHKVIRLVPQVSMQELLIAFNHVLQRAEMYSHHHVQLEQLSVRQRMADVLAGLQDSEFREFSSLFTLAEGRRGVVVTFLALLELIKQTLIELVQAETFGPIHVKSVGATHVDLSLVVIEGENE